MQQNRDATDWVVGPLASLLRKPLELIEGPAGEDDHSTIHLGADRVLISRGEGFSDQERNVISLIADLLRQVEEGDLRSREMEARILDLSRENLELTLRNRVLSEVSARDSLTGLYNRWYVMEKIESEINRSIRHGSPMALMMLDIDHFKNVNDTWGHSAGDRVLQSVGKLLRESCRVYDVPGRYGGEEFCVLLPETDIGKMPTVAERIRARLEMTETEVSGASLVVTASIGVAGLERTGEEPTLNPIALIDRADRALYSAKQQGRNRVAIWSDEADGGIVFETNH